MLYRPMQFLFPNKKIIKDIRCKYCYAMSNYKKLNYNNAGTVEFLVDPEDNIYFIEVNPRIQVEHTITEMITGIDLIKSQIFIAGGYKLSDKQIKIYDQDSLTTTGFALQCRSEERRV